MKKVLSILVLLTVAMSLMAGGEKEGKTEGAAPQAKPQQGQVVLRLAETHAAGLSHHPGRLTSSHAS